MRAKALFSRSGSISIGIASALLVAAAASAGAAGGQSVPLVTPPALQKTVSSVEAGEIAALPEGQAKTLVTERCLLCHGAGLITAQSKDAAAWGRTVTQMRTWGTPIQDDDQTAIVAYLAQHYGKKP